MPVSSARAQPTRYSTQNNGGIEICCCRVFTCVNLGFLTSPHGLLKISEVVLGSCCQTLLIRFGLPNAEDIGQAFNSFLTTSSSCLMTASILLFCYVISTRTFQLVRQSLFVSCFCFYLKWTVLILKRKICMCKCDDAFFGCNNYSSLRNSFYFILFEVI